MKPNNPDDFVLDDSGVTILDSIAMRLQVVGELLKKIEKEKDPAPIFLKYYPATFRPSLS